MNTLNLGSDEIPATKKKSNTRNLKIALGLAAVILVPTIGSTLAGSITVTDASIEFGQGFTSTISCNGVTPITITPASALTEGEFNLDYIEVDGIETGCDGKIFTLKVLNDTDTVQTLSTTANYTDNCTVVFENTGGFSTSSNCDISDGDSNTFRVAPKADSTLLAGVVYAITLESSDA